MTHDTLRLQPGTLWARIVETSGRALAKGALQVIPTVYEFVEQGGIQFLVRSVSNLVRRDAALQTRPSADFNPFLPYEPDLFVADISATHVCLLNKFNVVDHHILLITRAFEEQESLLNEQDFAALWACMAEFEGLAFYNAGSVAGASQRHKHLQIIPLPFVPQGPRVPIEPVLAAARFEDALGTAPALPFVHAVARLDPTLLKSPQAAARTVLESYHALLHAVGIDPGKNAGYGAYNLLATREWLFLVPRVLERFGTIPVNALGFAGAFLVRDEQQKLALKEHGPLAALQSIAVAR